MTMSAARPIYWWGRKREGTLVAIPKEMLTETVPGAIYEIHIECDKEPPPQETIHLITNELPKRVPVKIHYVEVQGKTVKIQLEGSPIAWELILSALPLILALIGVTILFIAVYNIFAGVPSWAWAMLVLGILLLWFLPGISDIFKGLIETFKTKE